MSTSKNIIEIARIGLRLAQVNFRLRIEGSYLGIFWYLLKPLLLFAVLIIVRQAAFPDTIIPVFPLYLLIGIAGFNFFREAITSSIEVISHNPEYIKSLNRLKPESLIVAIIIQAIFSHAFEFIMIVILAIYYQTPLVGLFAYPAALMLLALLTLGISFICAAIGTYISDLNNIWIIASQLLLLATPIFYTLPTSGIIYQINLLNPLFYFLETARALVIEGNLPDTNILISFVIFSVLSFIVGNFIFSYYKKKFAEIL